MFPVRILLVCVLAVAAINVARACSLCALSGKRHSLGGELDRSEFAIYGTIANPRFVTDGRPGAGVTEFRIEKVFKNHPDLGTAKTIELPRYLPVLDPKNPPRYVVFGDFHKGKPDTFQGFSIRTPAVLEYLEATRPLRNGPRLDALTVYARYLDHPDPQVAEDAFLEFALSRDHEVLEAAKKVDLDKLRKLLADPKLDADRASLFAFMLGTVGQARDAEWFVQVLQKPTPEQARGFDGLLAGYMTLDPKNGWTKAWEILGDAKKPFVQRYGAIRAVRFFRNADAKALRPRVLHGYKLGVLDGELADIAIDDLRQWKAWELTDIILEQYGKSSHRTSIVERGIVRYALCCPLPQARALVERARRTDAEMVRDIEDSLKAN
ncbi:MAG: hypothetical protein K2X38_08110 [Gemmataceae bacterium]|nr:hypothetical protein [Gemmataceae bacterium]